MLDMVFINILSIFFLIFCGTLEVHASISNKNTDTNHNTLKVLVNDILNRAEGGFFMLSTVLAISPLFLFCPGCPHLVCTQGDELETVEIVEGGSIADYQHRSGQGRNR